MNTRLERLKKAQSEINEDIIKDVLITGKQIFRIHYKVIQGFLIMVCGGEVVLVGLGRFKTNKQGCVRFYVPRADYHPLTIRFEDYKETNYLQEIKPATTYIFQPKKKLLATGNPVRDSGSILVEQSRN